MWAWLLSHQFWDQNIYCKWAALKKKSLVGERERETQRNKYAMIIISLLCKYIKLINCPLVTKVHSYPSDSPMNEIPKFGFHVNLVYLS